MPAREPRRAGNASSSSSWNVLTLPVENTAASPGSARTRPENEPANAGSCGAADSLPPRGPLGPLTSVSAALIVSFAHIAVERLPAGGAIGGGVASLRFFGGGGGCVSGRRGAAAAGAATTGSPAGGVTRIAGATVRGGVVCAGTAGGDIDAIVAAGFGVAARCGIGGALVVGAPIGGVLIGGAPVRPGSGGTDDASGDGRAPGGGGIDAGRGVCCERPAANSPVLRASRPVSSSSSPSGRIVPPALVICEGLWPRPRIVERGSTGLAGSALPVGFVVRCARVSSATVKYCASSPISPSRFQVLPVREISDSRVTTPATIHCCRIASSRQLFCSPFSRRISHWRSFSAPGAPSSLLPGVPGSSRIDSPARAAPPTVGGLLVDFFGRSIGIAAPDAGAAPTFVIARLRILNMCPQFVHLTVTPVGFEPSFIELVLGLALLAADVHLEARDLDAKGCGDRGQATTPRPSLHYTHPMADQPRSAERVRVDAFVKVHGADGQELVFRTRNLSEHGLFLYTKVARSYPFKVGSTLALELYDYDEQVTCKVVIVRVVEPGSSESATFPTGFGVRIVECDAAARLRLASLIQRIKTTGAAL